MKFSSRDVYCNVGRQSLSIVSVLRNCNLAPSIPVGLPSGWGGGRGETDQCLT